MKKLVAIAFFGYPIIAWGMSDEDKKLQELPYYVGLTPGKKLKTPDEIIAEINQFKKAIKNPSLIPDQLKEETAKTDITTAHTLLHNAYFARFLCDKYLNDDSVEKRDVEDHIRNYQTWSFDPARNAEFKKQNPNASRDDYFEHLEAETKKIIEDCQKCYAYKKTLAIEIDGLYSNIMYDKTRHGDPLAELQTKTHSDLQAKNQKLNQAFKDKDWGKILEMRKKS